MTTTCEIKQMIISQYMEDAVNWVDGMENQPFDVYGFDSIDMIELVIWIEDTFKIEIADIEFDKMPNLAAVIRLVEEKCNVS